MRYLMIMSPAIAAYLVSWLVTIRFLPDNFGEELRAELRGADFFGFYSKNEGPALIVAAATALLLVAIKPSWGSVSLGVFLMAWAMGLGYLRVVVLADDLRVLRLSSRE